MPTLVERLQTIHQRIDHAARVTGRDPTAVRLMLATKTQVPEVLRQAFACGEHLFGENRVQELVPKSDALVDLPITWHFIGHLQSNKVKDVVGRVSCIQSVDRPSIATAIDEECRKQHVVRDVMIEVNTSGEASKHGVAPSNVQELVDSISSFSTLRITGFMTIGALSEDERTVRRCFETLRNIRDAYSAAHGTTTELSMGMSDDLPWAIAEGSTIVRIGTAAFGER